MNCESRRFRGSIKSGRFALGGGFRHRYHSGVVSGTSLRQARMPMTSPQRRQTPVPKSAARMTRAERKRQLLAQAKQLFVTLGYHATTTEKIAAAAGITEPVL